MLGDSEFWILLFVGEELSLSSSKRLSDYIEDTDSKRSRGKKYRWTIHFQVH
jgi:hypothetical protein